MAIIDKIQEWLIKYQEEDDIEESVTAFEKSFEHIELSDGRKAQIKVVLEMDEEEW